MHDIAFTSPYEMIELPHLGLAAEKKDSTPFLMGFPNSVATLVGGFMLTQEKLKSIIHYCPDTGIFTRLSNGTKYSKGDIITSLLHGSYYRVMIDGKRYLCHRLAFLYIEGKMPDGIVDHINRDTKDNRFTNLRHAERRGNNININKKKNNTSGYTGVVFHKKTKKWRAQYAKGHIGLFDKKEDAFDAYCNACKKEYGDFFNSKGMSV
jgi:hypothetical protein